MGKRLELLLVEDTPSDIRLTEEALKDSELDFNLTVVNDGEQAMDYLNKQKTTQLPDVILLDLNMPKKNGHEVLADIKDDAALKEIPVVLLTVSQREEDIMQALHLKMNYYLCKPVDPEKLRVLINAIFALNSKSAQSLDSAQLNAEEVHVRYVLASNPHTAPVVLRKLAKDSNAAIRARVAENEFTPIDILQELALDQKSDVKISLSENPNTPEPILEKLAKDENEDVRLGIAENPKMPARILEILAVDENMYVAARAAKTLSH